MGIFNTVAKIGLGIGVAGAGSSVGNFLQNDPMPGYSIGSGYGSIISGASMLAGGAIGYKAATKHIPGKIGSFLRGVPGGAGKLAIGATAGAAYGVAKAPLVVAGDVGRMVRYATSPSYRRSSTMFSFADEGFGLVTANPMSGMGGRTVGWGALAGAGLAFGGPAIYPQADASRTMIAEQQMYDPVTGRRPRRMLGSNLHGSTQGLVQAMHLNA